MLTYAVSPSTEISETDKIVWYSLPSNFSPPISYLISIRRSSLETLKRTKVGRSKPATAVAFGDE